jgi:hypothetical protein
MNIADILQVVITSITSVVVALIGAGFFKNYTDKKKETLSKSKLMEQIRKDEIVHLGLRDLRRKYNADRIYIWQFHNGGNFYTSSPIQKTSITYERCSDGLERKSEKFQNTLISNISSYIRDTMNFEMFYYDVKEMNDIATRSICQSYSTQSHTAIPIFDEKEHLVGILSLDWVFSHIPEEFLTQEEFNTHFMSELKDEASSLKRFLI